MSSSQQLWDALNRVIDPELRVPLTDLGMIGRAEIGEAGFAEIDVKLTVVGCPASDKIERDVRAAAASIVGEDAVRVSMSVMSETERSALVEKLRAGKPPRTNPFDADTLTRVLLIGSGKGGVGKSTITANLAVAMANRNLRVGVIDADIFGFSIPGQLGLPASIRPTRVGELMLPPVAFGVKVISMGMFVDNNQPVAWRGPMLHRAVQQFLTDVHWGDLDVLLIDLPPGTGDIAISLGQSLPTAKSVVVTTPQVAAAEVAERSAAVGLQTGQAIAGVIENMSWLEQPDGTRVELFGAGGGDLVAKRLSEISGQPVPLLGRVPISVDLRVGSDTGNPLLATEQDASTAAQVGGGAAAAIELIAEKLLSTPLGLSGRKLKVSTQT